MSEAEILFEAHDGIARLVFNRPAARNAMTFAMYEQLEELCRKVDADASIKVLLLRGAGDKAFVSGTDIAQFRGLTTPAQAIAYEAKMDRVLDALEDVRVPTIAVLQGACTGGGAAIAAACDLRIAAPSVKFGFPIGWRSSSPLYGSVFGSGAGSRPRPHAATDRRARQLRRVRITRVREREARQAGR